MAEQDYIQRAREIVLGYANTHKEHEEDPDFTLEEIHVIHVATVLSNWTFIIKTFPADHHVYEVVHNAFRTTMTLYVYERKSTLIKSDKEHTNG